MDFDLKQVWPDWEIKRLIGEGSFGKVYEIVRNCHKIEEHCALKVISIPQSQAEIKSIRTDGMNDASITDYYRGIVDDFVQEIALMSKLKGHSNIVGYEDYAVVEHEDSVGWDILIRMELLTDLTSYLQNHSMNEKEVIKLAIDICEALEICHKQKIIHRDIKIDNIFISSNNSFKLGDFGVARNVEKTLSGLSKKGTYTYMAPEVYKGDDYNSNIDLYSLGIVMYKLLNNNREPFLPSYPNPIKYSDRNNALVRRMKGETILPPKNASKEISDIILKACAFNSVSRYQRPSEMKADLLAVYNLKDKTKNTVEEIKTITPPETESKKPDELDKLEKTVGPDFTKNDKLPEKEFIEEKEVIQEETENSSEELYKTIGPDFEADIPQQSEMPKPAEKTYPAYYKTDYQNAIRKIEHPLNKEESFQGVQVLKTIADEGYPPAISYLKYNSDTIQFIIEKFETTFKDNKRVETADDTSDYDKKMKIIVRSVAIALSVFVLALIVASILQISTGKNNESNNENSSSPELTQQFSTKETTNTVAIGKRDVQIISVTDNMGMTSSDAKVTYDGFEGWFTLEDGEEYGIIDKGLCIYGTLKYSKEPFYPDYDGHGGAIYDENENELNTKDISKHSLTTKDNYDTYYSLSFWSDPKEKQFSVGLPDDIKAGIYTVEIYQFFGDDEVKMRIKIVVE